MSILSDLDPKNARFDDDAANGGAGKMSWGGPLALFALAGLGLAAAVYHGGDGRSVSTNLVEPPVVNVATPQLGVSPSPIVPAAADKSVAVETATISAPLVELKPQALSSQGTKKKAAADKQPQQQAKINQADKKKLAASENTTKKTLKEGKTVKTARKATSKPAVRDVEIITAIDQADKKKLAASKNATEKTQKEGKTVKTAHKATSKPTARDVEIITAIVK